MNVIVFAALLSGDQFEKLDYRVSQLETRVEEVIFRLSALEEKVSPKRQAIPSAKTPTPTGKESFQVQTTYDLTPSVKTDDAPTFHYPAGTQMVCGPDGCIVPNQQPNSVSYPGGPMFQPIQGGNCANGQCGPASGRRGLFGRRR